MEYTCQGIFSWSSTFLQLSQIQSRLLDVGSYVATPAINSSDRAQKRVEFDSEHVLELESLIDDLDLHLPQLTNFILPSGRPSYEQLGQPTDFVSYWICASCCKCGTWSLLGNWLGHGGPKIYLLIVIFSRSSGQAPKNLSTSRMN